MGFNHVCADHQMACASCDCGTAVIVSFGDEPRAHVHCANCGGCWIVFPLPKRPEQERAEGNYGRVN